MKFELSKHIASQVNKIYEAKNFKDGVYQNWYEHVQRKDKDNNLWNGHQSGKAF